LTELDPRTSPAGSALSRRVDISASSRRSFPAACVGAVASRCLRGWRGSATRSARRVDGRGIGSAQSLSPQAARQRRRDLVALILSANVNRRHLSKGQCAMAVASAYPEGGEQGAGRGHKKQEVTSRFVFSDKLVLQARFVLRELPDLDRWFPAKRGASMPGSQHCEMATTMHSRGRTSRWTQQVPDAERHSHRRLI
jgi:hypothetical protein